MNKEETLKYIDEIATSVEEVSLDIWNHPEISGEESRSADVYRTKLKENGFNIVEVEGMPNAFYAEYGQGSPVFALLGEYDALPELSQNVEAERQPVQKGGPGHGCGHNLLGAAPYAAALALKKYLDQTNAQGTIRYYGCPEEETLVGKVKMLKAKAFDGCDIALSWHPMNDNVAVHHSYLANNSIKFRFKGVSSHAATAPEKGRSALDAVELMNIGANYLREHIIDKARMHYTITNAGGAPNIVPAEAESWYFIRAPRRSDVEEITAKLYKIAEGAALMTGTEVEHELLGGCYELLPNDTMFELTHKNLTEIAGPEYTEEEEAFALDLYKSLGHNEPLESAINKEVVSLEDGRQVFVGASSDSGDVSWNMPMNLFDTATWPVGVPAHSWQATAASGHSIGVKAMLYAAKVIAGMAIDLIEDPKLVEKAISEFKERTEKDPYCNPLDGE